jgi:glutamate--cysteine ligase
MSAAGNLSRPDAEGEALAPAGADESARWLREGVLPHTAAAQPRIGAEYELLVIEAGTRLPAQWLDGKGLLARWLLAHARRHAWQREASTKGAPAWALEGGGRFTLEPGGQVEYATPPFTRVDVLIADLHAVIEPLYESAAEFGIELLACGIDPHNDIAAAPLQFRTPRYVRMAAYFEQRGSAGARMMRQTASLQINIDPRFAPDATWCAANALAPYLLAMFANSRMYGGAATGSASYRARVWRELDPARTGLLPCTVDPALEYARFARAAPALLLEGDPFGARTRTEAQWRDHLTTLFPEVRPRGHLEIRSIDSVPLEQAGRALRVVSGLLWHPDAFAALAPLIGAPDAVLLEAAGEGGLDDETLRLRAERLAELGESAAGELSGASYAAPARPLRSRSCSG